MAEQLMPDWPRERWGRVSCFDIFVVLGGLSSSDLQPLICRNGSDAVLGIFLPAKPACSLPQVFAKQRLSKRRSRAQRFEQIALSPD
jgi:hypothetical protein